MEALQYILTSCNTDVVFGNFNINYFSQNLSNTLSSLMESLNYSQIVTEPTFVSAGTLLDHVHVQTTSIQVNNCSVVSVYYSDPGLVGPAHAWSQIAMQKEAKIYQKRPNYNFSNAAK